MADPKQSASWQPVEPLETGSPVPDQRKVDVAALVAGIVFVVLAITLMTGFEIPGALADGGLVWLVLVGAGIALLVSELRRARRRN